MGSVEVGGLWSRLVFSRTQTILTKAIPPMNIAPRLYRAQRRRIERRLHKSQDKLEALRCRILLLLNAGRTPKEISTWLGCARATVYRTFYRFEELGETGLADKRLAPAPRKVTLEVSQYLYSLLDHSPQELGWQRSSWTLELLSLQVHERMGVRLSLSHVRNTLLWLGCRRGRPRPGLKIPFRGRRRILEAIQRLIRQSSHQDEVFYLDEADIDLNPRIGSCYMKRRKQRVVLTPGKNEKRYLAGALNARTGRVVHTISKSKSSGLFIDLLQKMNGEYRRAERLHLILDNYIIHKSKRTLSWLKRFGSRFVFHFLPPYSPEHNVIERLWKQMHDHVTRNHRHREMSTLMAAVESFLRNVQPFPGTKVSYLTLAA